MRFTTLKLNPYFAAFLIILSLSLAINYFAIPNMLSHDQLSQELILLKMSKGDLFSKDAYFQDGGWIWVYNPWFPFLKLVTKYTGSLEETYRILIPISFFIFVYGMFLFLYAVGINPVRSLNNTDLTITDKSESGFALPSDSKDDASRTSNRVNYFISIGVAVISSIYIPNVLLEDWGIGGPSYSRPRFLGLALITYAFWLFYKFWGRKNLPWLFFFIGLAGNIHIPTAFFVTLILMLTMIAGEGFNKNSLKKIALSGILALAGLSPFLVFHYWTYKAPPLIINDAAAYINALQAAYPHLSWTGITSMYEDFFITRWYLFWPLFSVFLFMLPQRKKTGEFNQIDKISIIIASVIIISTLSISAANQVLQYGFEKPPFTIQDPRIFRYIYFVLYLYFAFFLGWLWKEFRGSDKKIIVLGLAFMLLGTGGAITGYKKFNQAKRLLYLKKTFADSGNTCRAPMYDWINNNINRDKIFLIDPNKYPPFRNCTLQNIVYTYRDSNYITGMSYITEWHRRKVLIEDAYSRKNADKIIEISKTYNADYIVSSQCLEFPNLKKLYEEIYEDNLKENCIYQTSF